MANKSLFKSRLTGYSIIFMLFGAFITSACNEDKEIRTKLSSAETNTIIEGAYKAGESGDKKYVPLLLNNLNDRRRSTSLLFIGFTVYTEKMFALERILKVKPPVPYKGTLALPDSANIKFYNNLWREMNKTR